MVEETIQVIRETEAKADAITRDAEVKGNQIVDDAEKTGETMERRTISCNGREDAESHVRCKRRRRTGTSRDAVKD